MDGIEVHLLEYCTLAASFEYLHFTWPITDCDTLFGCNAVTDWPDHFLISHTRSLWAEVQTDTMEERVSESMLSVWLMPG